MPYYKFGFTPGDVVTNPAGDAIAGRELAVWTAYTGGSQVTDLRDINDSPLPGLVETDSIGRYPFQAPDSNAVYWIDDGQNARWAVAAAEVYGLAASAAAQAANAEVNATAALAAATAASSAVSDLEESIGGSSALSNAVVVADDEQYDVTGGSSTNDFVGLQAALNDAAGKLFIIPKGTFRTDSPLIIPTGTHILLVGDLISGTGEPLFYNYTATDETNGLPGYTGRGRIIISGPGTLDMRADVLGSSDIHNCVTFAHCEDITVRDITILNVKGYHALEFHSVRHALVDNVKFKGYDQDVASFPREAIQIDMMNMAFDDNTPCDDIIIQNCWCGPSAELGPWGRFVGGHTVGTVPYQRITVDNNTIIDPIDAGIQGYSWSNSIITRNKVFNSGGIGIGSRAVAGAAPQQLMIADNIVDDPAGVGIFVDSSDNGTTRYTRVTVDNNIVRDSGSNNILLCGVNRAVVRGNECDDNSANNNIQVGDAVLGGALSPLIEGNWCNLSASNGIAIRNAPGAVIRNNKVCEPAANPFSVTGSVRVSILMNDSATKADGTTANGRVLTGTSTRWLGCNTSSIWLTAPSTAGTAAFTIGTGDGTTEVATSGSNLIA